MIDQNALFVIFMDEGIEQLNLLEQGLLRLETAPDDLETINELYRAAHTLKGGCYIVGLGEAGDFCHKLEDVLGDLRQRQLVASSALITELLRAVDLLKQSLQSAGSGGKFPIVQSTTLLARLDSLRISPTDPPPELPRLGNSSEPLLPAQSATIRVELGKIEQLVNNVGEMLIVHAMLNQTLLDLHGVARLDSRLAESLTRLQRLGRELQENTMALRMQPVTEVFQRCERTVRDIAAAEGKPVQLLIEGGETEFDKGVMEKLTDPLLHLLRNAIDHGLETPPERRALGKPEQGRITLRAYEQGGAVYIEVQDDGRGLNRNSILAAAREHGLLAGAEVPGDEELYALIFRPGFSTAKEVTDLSGRGVGMDVVRRNIELLQGSIQLASEPGAGTTVTLKLPLTMAILDGLAVRVGREIFLIPLWHVLESFRPSPGQVQLLTGKGEMVFTRAAWLPVVRLHRRLAISDAFTEASCGILVLLDVGGRRCALLVDEIIGQQQVVLKNLGAATPPVNGIAGGTILGDGRVALVLDAAGLLTAALNEEKHDGRN